MKSPDDCCVYCYWWIIGNDEACGSRVRMIVTMENRCPNFDPCTPINKKEGCKRCGADEICAEQREKYLLKEDD